MLIINNTLRNIILLGIALGLPLLAWADNWKMELDLSGTWKFSIGDNPEWASPEYDDASWESIRVPSPWESRGFHGYDGYAWYRKTFRLPANLNTDNLYLSLGYIDDVDEVYLNGKLIGFSGSFPPYFHTAYNAYRRYPMPAEWLNPNGNNVISVRVYDTKLDGGIIAGKIGIMVDDSETQLDVDLRGVWNFALGDNLKWKDPDWKDDDWEKIMVPYFWEAQGFYNYDGYAWYRKTFFLPNEYAHEDMLLLLGRIDDYDQVFVNGVKVGSTGYLSNGEVNMRDDAAYQQNRNYTVPADVLQPGSFNTVAVRVYDKYIDGGIYSGPVGLILQNRYTRFWRISN
ncbi:MAG: beta galactosidase jelly roll domain-containing protein [Cyclobacteriaceae bacterium]